MKKQILFTIFLSITIELLSSSLVFAQIGGNNTFEFLNLSPSARLTALGGIQIAILDDDVNLAAQNPALYNPTMNSHLAINTIAHLADISHTYVGFAKTIDSTATIGGGLQYTSYGNFTATNDQGDITGSFKGGEYALQIAGGRQIGYFSYGATAKFIGSSLDIYRSYGLAADLGGAYYNPESLLGIGLVIKNIGYQIKPYNTLRERLPFEIQLGISKKLKHMPFRFSIVAHNLQQLDIRYDDPNQATQEFVFGEDEGDKSYLVDKIFRHLIFAGEMYLGKALRLQFGYNHQRRQELSPAIRSGLSGFSFGAGLHIRKFQVSYGRAIYHLAGGTNHFSVSTRLSSWKKNKLKFRS